MTTLDDRFDSFIGELPYYAPLLNTPKGDAAVYFHVLPGSPLTIEVKYLVALERGAGRAAMEIITAAADKHRVTLTLTAVPQKKVVAGKRLSVPKLQKFYSGFGFTPDKRFAAMRRTPQKGTQ
jgi:hypothetical protein